jgi:hypothetical protein
MICSLLSDWSNETWLALIVAVAFIAWVSLSSGKKATKKWQSQQTTHQTRKTIIIIERD